MPWFKVDDGFPAHRKVEALQALPPAAYTAAITIWTLMGADCGLNLSDGVFSRVRARKITGLPDKLLDAGLAALVKVGLFDRADEECVFHDWGAMQPTKAQVEAQRAAKVAAGRSGGRASGESRSKQVLHENEAGASPETKQTPSTLLPNGEAIRARLPSRPDPSPTRTTDSGTSANGAGAPPAAGARKLAASKRPAKPAAEGEQPPRPFSIGAALAAIADASDTRFAAPVGDELHGRHFGAMWKLIDAHPRLEEWARVGRWLAVGGMGRRTDLSVAWLRDSDAFALARTWEENGAPNLGRTPTLAVRGPVDPAEEAALAAARRDLEARPRLPLPIATHHGAAH